MHTIGIPPMLKYFQDCSHMADIFEGIPGFLNGFHITWTFMESYLPGTVILTRRTWRCPQYSRLIRWRPSLDHVWLNYIACWLHRTLQWYTPCQSHPGTSADMTSCSRRQQPLLCTGRAWRTGRRLAIHGTHRLRTTRSLDANNSGCVIVQYEKIGL